MSGGGSALVTVVAASTATTTIGSVVAFAGCHIAGTNNCRRCDTLAAPQSVNRHCLVKRLTLLDILALR